MTAIVTAPCPRTRTVEVLMTKNHTLKAFTTNFCVVLVTTDLSSRICSRLVGHVSLHHTVVLFSFENRCRAYIFPVVINVPTDVSVHAR